MVKHVHNLKHLRGVRKELRSTLTPEEAILWNVLKDKNLGQKFRRQHSIGNFIADFYCPKKKLAIELDGSQHLDAKEKDSERADYFNSLGIKVLRFWNSEINSNIENVIKRIRKELNT